MASEWHYTKESGVPGVTTARKGLWYVEMDGDEASIWHNDLPPMSLARIDTGSHEADRVSGTGAAPLAMLRDFLAWHTDPADLTPDEPTTFGYVGYVTDADGDVWDVSRYGIVLDPYQLCNRKTGKPGSGDWPDVLALGTFTVVERD